MVRINRSALVRYTPEQMFDLVNDVEAYPKRFPWCVDASVNAREGDTVEARLDLRFAGLKQHFTTRNTAHRPQRLDMHFVDGPFRTLQGVWTFVPLGEGGCKVALALEFEMASRLGTGALRLGFEGLANRMVNDFCAEAKRTYG